jgi:hypothetical protein
MKDLDPPRTRLGRDVSDHKRQDDRRQAQIWAVCDHNRQDDRRQAQIWAVCDHNRGNVLVPAAKGGRGDRPAAPLRAHHYGQSPYFGQQVERLLVSVAAFGGLL